MKFSCQSWTNLHPIMMQIGFILLCLAYCATASHQKAVAVLENKEKGISGVIIFEETDHGVLVQGNITGLKSGKHGFHVHEKGNITDAKCLSAGGHFNPFNKTHGGPTDSVRHVGDLGNINATTGETTIFSVLYDLISLKGDTSIMGRAIVIHEDTDDFGRGNASDSKITGHAGARLVCAVIRSGATSYSSSVIFVLSMFLIVKYL